MRLMTLFSPHTPCAGLISWFLHNVKQKRGVYSTVFYTVIEPGAVRTDIVHSADSTPTSCAAKYSGGQA